MKKVLIVLLAMVTLAILSPISAKAEDWYMLDLGGFSYGKCFSEKGNILSSPAEKIKSLRESHSSYEVLNEVVVNGKVVEVTIYDKTSIGKYTFYRLERCQQVLNARKAKKAEELTKYK